MRIRITSARSQVSGTVARHTWTTGNALPGDPATGNVLPGPNNSHSITQSLNLNPAIARSLALHLVDPFVRFQFQHLPDCDRSSFVSQGEPP